MITRLQDFVASHADKNHVEAYRKNIDVVREVQVEHAQNGVVLKKEELNRANQIQQDSGESRKTLFIALLLVGVILIKVMVFLKRKK